MTGSQKRIGKKLKGEGNLDSDVKVRRCGLGDGPKRCCRGEMEEKKGNSSPEPPLPKNTHAQGVAECADQGSAFTVTRGMTFLLILGLKEPAIVIIILQGKSDKQQAFCNLRHESKLTL